MTKLGHQRPTRNPERCRGLRLVSGTPRQRVNNLLPLHLSHFPRELGPQVDIRVGITQQTLMQQLGWQVALQQPRSIAKDDCALHDVA